MLKRSLSLITGRICGRMFVCPSRTLRALFFALRIDVSVRVSTVFIAISTMPWRLSAGCLLVRRTLIAFLGPCSGFMKRGFYYYLYKVRVYKPLRMPSKKNVQPGIYF
jgi:hypothetical protein